MKTEDINMVIIKLNMFEFYALLPQYYAWVEDTQGDIPTKQEVVYYRALQGKPINFMEQLLTGDFIIWVEENACKEDLEELKSTIQYMKGVLNIT